MPLEFSCFFFLFFFSQIAEDKAKWYTVHIYDQTINSLGLLYGMLCLHGAFLPKMQVKAATIYLKIKLLFLNIKTDRTDLLLCTWCLMCVMNSSVSILNLFAVKSISEEVLCFCIDLQVVVVIAPFDPGLCHSIHV